MLQNFLEADFKEMASLKASKRPLFVKPQLLRMARKSLQNSFFHNKVFLGSMVFIEKNGYYNINLRSLCVHGSLHTTQYIHTTYLCYLQTPPTFLNIFLKSLDLRNLHEIPQIQIFKNPEIQNPGKLPFICEIDSSERERTTYDCFVTRGTRAYVSKTGMDWDQISRS